MSAKLEVLSQKLMQHLGDRIELRTVALGEVTIDVRASDYLEVVKVLRDADELRFEELIDLCGVDYLAYGNDKWAGKRFAAISHLTSITHNWRLRVRCFAPDDNFPSIPSVVSIWNSANWFEREAFDLYGIVFPGHNDLRRFSRTMALSGIRFARIFQFTATSRCVTTRINSAWFISR